MIPPPPRSTLFPYTTLFRSLHLFKTRQQGRPPRGRTLGSRRQIARLASSRITKTHGRQSKALGGIKSLAADAQPRAQPIATGIVKRQPSVMGTCARGLGGNQNARLWMSLQNGPRLQRQAGFTQATGANGGQQGIK